MVDTLAPKRIFTQRDLDKSLIQPTPVGQSIMAPASNVLDTTPDVSTQKSLTDTPQPDYVVDKNQVFNMMQNLQKASRSRVAETRDTVKSSEETTKEKQTGMRTERQETPQSGSLVMRPVEYAADGVKDKEVSGPILVGEKGAELVVPTGEGKVSILDAKTTSGLMKFPGYGDEMITTKYVEDLSEKQFEDPKEPSKLQKRQAFKRGKKAEPELVKILQADEDENFIKYMKKVENAKLLAGDTSMLQHDSAEGGNKTIAYGHKLTDKERELGKVYGYDIENLTIEQANEILKRDLSKAYDQLTNTFGRQFLDLDDRRKQMLVDMQFNLGSLEAFPKFTEALFAGDETTMMKEYKRSFRDPESGNMKPLTGRNKDFNEFFFKGMAKASLVTKPIKKAEKGAKNVEIGKAEPAGFFFRNPATPDKESGGEKLLKFFFGDKDEEEETAMRNPMRPSVAQPGLPADEGAFDISKIMNENGGIDINYFYDNIDDIARYGFQQRFGTDREPTKQELKDAEEEAFAKMRAYLDMSLKKSEKDLLETYKEEYRKPDPYDPLGKRKQKLLDEYGPEILPEV